MTMPSPRRSPISRRFARFKMQLAASEAVGNALHRALPLSDHATKRRLKIAARRISACAASTTIKLQTPPGDATRIIYRNKRRCRNGLCPPCARVRARETVQRITRTLDRIIAEAPATRFAFLTLTSRNMPITEVAAMLALHERALARFFRANAINRAVQGHATGIEIAIRRCENSWHAGVHSHSLLALHPHYFDRTKNLYLSQAAIVAHWRKALRVDYKPVCHIKAIPNTDAVRGSLTECLKYAVAPHRLFEHGSTGISVDPLVAACLANALYKKRMRRTAGVFARRRTRSRAP